MKSFKKLALALTLIALTVGIFGFSKANALSGSDWKAGRIIDDAIFYNSGTMSTSQVQDFLNAKVPTCDTYHAKSSSPNDSGPPYTCLKNYSQSTPSKSANSYCSAYTGGTKSAARIIHDVGKACGVSQKVIIVLLQKEQSLITDTWPWDIQYKTATGYGCPDSTGCDSQYYGFFNQVYLAAKQFKRYRANPSGYNFRAGFTNSIQYNPNTACGSSDVYINNQATAGLYNYTPYQPNQAALNNLYGTGNSCSAYGNRNFWRLFIDWFGSTKVNVASYAWSVVSKETFLDPGMTKKFTSKTTVEPNDKIYARIKAKNTGYSTWSQVFLRLGTYSPSDRNSIFEDSSWPDSHRPTQLLESTVASGQIGTFEFILDAPASTGGYKESFNAVAESRTWLNDGNADFSINVVGAVAPDSTNNTLSADERLYPGEYLLSADRQSVLILQKDGNLVEYRNFKPVWHTGTYGEDSKFLVMQDDGNLVLYDKNNKPLWHTHTYGNSGSELKLQSDSNLVIYSAGNTPLWANGKLHIPNLLKYVNTTLNARLYKGQELETPNRLYKLILQSDGNLVLYKSGAGALWHSHTYGKPSFRLEVQHDGNLVLYDTSGKPLWNTGTNGRGNNVRLVQQSDGNLVLYDSNNKPLWNTETNSN